jgi:ADP-heptose:LPS heptosyltransferase
MPDQRILVVRGGAIGDFVLTLPVLAALRRHFPNARVEVLGYSSIAALAVAGGLADRVRGLEERGFATFFARGVAMPREQAEFFRPFALIISYLYDPDGIFQENVRRCSSAQFLAGPARVDPAELVHVTDALLKPLERLAIFDEPAEPRLAPGRAASPGAGQWLAAHVGSGSESRVWLERGWVEVLQWVLRAPGWRVLLIGGEAERSRLERLAAALPAERVRVLRGVPWGELTPLLAGCRAFLGHDTGVTHLAAALGLPGVVLWADRVEKVWCPRSAGMRVVRSPVGVLGITAGQVTAALAGVMTAGISAFDKASAPPA